MPSDGDRQRRGPRRLEISDALAALLGGLRERHAVTALPEVDLDQLHGVEIAVSFHFADDILAVWAARIPPLVAVGFTAGEVVGHCGRLRDLRARGDLLGVAETDAGELWAIDKRHAGEGATRLTRVNDARTGEVLDLEAWVRQVAGDASGPPLEAALHRKPPMAGAGGRRVRHAKFGLGTAFSESGLGPNRKVTCDFPGLGLKTIQARFLEFLDG